MMLRQLPKRAKVLLPKQPLRAPLVCLRAYRQCMSAARAQPKQHSDLGMRTTES